ARGWVSPDAVAGWLWSHHPSWAAAIPPAEAADKGAGWVRAFLLGVAYPLGVAEVAREADDDADDAPRELVRLSPLGRHFLFGEPEPAAPPAFPQTLLVQPNAEVLAYRQGLTPALAATLSRFAGWKGLGPACTLELTPEQTYRGLESGLTLPMIVQTLNRHGTRPVPPGVADLLQRWASKRERITVFASAVLVEFPTPAELEQAVARGVVAVRLTDRIGLTADGREPSLSNLRLIGNRDYESKPQKCLTVADDGVTLTVDTPQADLLLEAEIGQFAEPLPVDPANGVRRFKLTPASLRRAADSGRALSDLDAWFNERSGSPLSAAGRLLLLGSQMPAPQAARLLVVKLPTVELADGLMQWPETRGLVAERLGPLAVSVDEEAFEAFRAALREAEVEVGERTA
ncbi:MAG: helicase-associated domain-containing protein, partial [Gemmataceae bacterium]|nr:helicase-associated domain-containing protein [Gemmataceae bacterium]